MTLSYTCINDDDDVIMLLRTYGLGVVSYEHAHNFHSQVLIPAESQVGI